MIKFSIGGKSVRPDDIGDALMNLAVEKIKDEMRRRMESIRLPSTGEFPTVVAHGSTLDDIAFTIEGSPELIALVEERLKEEEGGIEGGKDGAPGRVTLRPTTPATAPKAFLSYTFDDADLARKIANALQANGIETFLAEWSIHPGDSLRQKVDEGISDCTHFLVLLTPKSIVKPWVNQEMDAGFVRKLEEKARFIAIRAGLDVSALPVTLRSMHSPSIDNFEADIRQLVNDIHGITRRPPLGPAPTPATPVSTGHSEAANKIAKLMVEASEHAVHADPFFSVDEIAAKTGLSNDDVTDGAHELRQFLGKRFEGFFAKPELFAEFDRFFLGTNPRDDALRLAADMINDSNFPTQTPEIAKRYGWTARRINPAISYLLSRNLIRDSSELNSHPWITVWVDKTDETRRFVKSKT